MTGTIEGRRRGRPWPERDWLDRVCQEQCRRVARKTEASLRRIAEKQARLVGEAPEFVDTYRLSIQPLCLRLDQLDGEPQD